MATAFLTSPELCSDTLLIGLGFLTPFLKAQAPLGWMAIEKPLKEQVPVGTVLG